MQGTEDGGATQEAVCGKALTRFSVHAQSSPGCGTDAGRAGVDDCNNHLAAHHVVPTRKFLQVRSEAQFRMGCKVHAWKKSLSAFSGDLPLSAWTGLPDE